MRQATRRSPVFDVRAIALQGVGFGPRQMAAQGLLQAFDQVTPPIHPPRSGGRLVGVAFKMPRPDGPKLKRTRRNDILFLKP